MPASVKFDYSGAKVLVVGGTGGIGLATAKAYRDAGAQVTITGTRASAADYDRDLAGYRYFQLDVENDAQIDAVAAAQEELDILVASGGIAFASIGQDEHDPTIFARAINMHLTSVYRIAHGCFAALSRSKLPGGASVVGIASMSSYFGMGIVPGYGSAKTGLMGLMRTLAVDWAQHGIRANAVAAGLVHSNMTSATFENPEWTEPTLARTPAGRLGEPEDIAGPVLFLTSPAASWITGQTLAVDGGFTICG